MPDLTKSINLSNLGIDFETLQTIKTFFINNNYEPKSISDQSDLVIEAKNKDYISSLHLEKLLLLTLASHKLGIQSLQDVACETIASYFKNSALPEELLKYESLNDSKHVDYCLLQERTRLNSIFYNKIMKELFYHNK